MSYPESLPFSTRPRSPTAADKLRVPPPEGPRPGEETSAERRVRSNLDIGPDSSSAGPAATSATLPNRDFAVRHLPRRQSPHRSRETLRHLVPWLLPLLLLAVWEFASRGGVLSSRVLPEPLAVVNAAVKLARSGELWTDMLASATRALLGFAIGGSLGLLLGIGTGLWRPVESLLDSTLQMIRNIPALATIPLVILWFGIDESAKLFLVALGVFFPIYLNTFHGIRSVDRDLVEMARSYDLRGWPLCRDVILPGALPSILVGVRFALGLMWVMLIVAETVSAQSGIGYMTMNAREFLQTDVVLVGILLYALLGKLADSFAKALDYLLVPWQRGAKRGAHS